MEAGKFTLDNVGDSITIYRPIFPYTCFIDMAIDRCPVSTRDDTGDNGTDYDIRYCDATLELDATEQQSFFDFVNRSGRTTTAIDMILPAGSGFHPFGPDKADGGTFSVAFSVLRWEGIGDRPYKYFRTKVRFVNQGSFPAHTYPTVIDEGGLTIGTVSGIRFPPQWFKPLNQIHCFLETTRDGTVELVDEGESADTYSTSLNLICNESKASRIINYLTGTARATTFNIATSADYYAYGIDKSNSGTYTTRLKNNVLEIKNNRYNEWEFELGLTFEGVS